MPSITADLRTEGRWTPEALDEALPSRLLPLSELSDFLDV
jgi:hypothetical protein